MEVDLESEVKTARFNGSLHLVISWRYQAASKLHQTKLHTDTSVRSNSSADWFSTTRVGDVVAIVDLEPGPVVLREKSEEPVFSSYVEESSEGYFRLGFVGTFPVPTDWLPYLVTASSLGIKVGFLLDTKWGDGTYSDPEDVKVNLYGFGDVREWRWDPFKKIKDLYAGSLDVVGTLRPSETYPRPHIVIDFKVEVTGVPSGTHFWQDWDAFISWSFFGWVNAVRATPIESETSELSSFEVLVASH